MSGNRIWHSQPEVIFSYCVQSQILTFIINIFKTILLFLILICCPGLPKVPCTRLWPVPPFPSWLCFVKTRKQASQNKHHVKNKPPSDFNDRLCEGVHLRLRRGWCWQWSYSAMTARRISDPKVTVRSRLISEYTGIATLRMRTCANAYDWSRTAAYDCCVQDFGLGSERHNYYDDLNAVADARHGCRQWTEFLLTPAAIAMPKVCCKMLRRLLPFLQVWFLILCDLILLVRSNLA